MRSPAEAIGPELVDSTSLHNIINAFKFRRPEDAPAWALMGATEITSALISSDRLIVAPGPASESAPSGEYGRLRTTFGGVVALADLSSSVHDRAYNATRAWAHRSVGRLGEVPKALATDRVLASWLAAHTHFWPEHARRLGALFDREHVRVIAKALGRPADEIERLRQRSGDVGILSKYIGGDSNTDEYKILRDAFLISYMIRGRYHHWIARACSGQIIHHNTRNIILPPVSGRITELLVPTAELYLTNVVLSSSYSESSPGGRFGLWAENVLRMRPILQASRSEFSETSNDEQALRIALGAAARGNVRVHSKLLERMLGTGTVMGVGVLTSFVLVGWEGFVAGVAAAGAVEALGGNRGLAAWLNRRRGRLRDLATSGPGRVLRTWRR
jgi:hypothetical protein